MHSGNHVVPSRPMEGGEQGPMRRSSPARVTSFLFLTLSVLIAGAHPAGAQEQPPADSLAAQLARLTAVVDSLRAEVARLKAEGEEKRAQDALAKLREAARTAAAAGGARKAPDQEQKQFVGRQRSLQALNPEISVTGDVFAQVNKDDVDAENFFAREFELSFVSNLDPYSRAKAFISRHVPGGEITPFREDAHAHEGGEEGAGFSVEEGYVEWVNIPGGLGLKLGRFYQQFGQLNRWHSHALSFQSRSLPSLAFIGEEPLAQTGASVHWLAPFSPAGGTYETTVEVTRSEAELLFGESNRPSVLANVNAFWQLSRATDLDLSLSWVNGSYEDEAHLLDRTLYAAEVAFTWRPPARARYRGFQFRGGVMVLDGLLAHDDTHQDPAGAEGAEEGDFPEQAKGFWSQGELRLSQRWLAGARFDWTENPEDPDQTAWLLSPTLTWWQSEYVRIRAEYDLVGRSFETAREGKFLLQVTFAMGPHKHETY